MCNGSGNGMGSAYPQYGALGRQTGMGGFGGGYMPSAGGNPLRGGFGAPGGNMIGADAQNFGAAGGNMAAPGGMLTGFGAKMGGGAPQGLFGSTGGNMTPQAQQVSQQPATQPTDFMSQFNSYMKQDPNLAYQYAMYAPGGNGPAVYGAGQALQQNQLAIRNALGGEDQYKQWLNAGQYQDPNAAQALRVQYGGGWRNPITNAGYTPSGVDLLARGGVGGPTVNATSSGGGTSTTTPTNTTTATTPSGPTYNGQPVPTTYNQTAQNMFPQWNDWNYQFNPWAYGPAWNPFVGSQGA